MTAKRTDRRTLRRLEAEERQAAHDREVSKAAAEHNVSWETARDVVRSRKRFEHMRRTRERVA